MQKNRLTSLLAGAGAVLVLAAPGAAGVVAFDNPAGAGHYTWWHGGNNGILDFRLPADQQPGLLGGLTSLNHRDDSDPPEGLATNVANNLEPNTLVQVADAEFSGIFYLVGAQAGETIDAGFGTIWRDNGEVYYPGHGGELPEGAVRYLGVRFDPGDGYHYGWIGVVRTGMILDALAWGYETQPNTPVGAGVPAPGASGLFLIVAGLTVRRKRIVA